MRNITLLAVLVALTLGQACNITTSVHFNRDYSGTYETILDMSELIGFASMMDTTGEADQNDMIVQMRKSMDSLGLADVYNGMSGIRDARVEVTDEGVMTIGFLFDNIDALNASFETMKERAGEQAGDMGSMDMMPTDFLGGGNSVFTRNNKTIEHTFSMEEGVKGLMGEGGEDSEMEMVSSMIDYTVELSFDRKVKSAELEGMDLVEKGTNIVKARVDLGKLLKEGKYSVKVKTK